jgi:hypothetical protein
MFWGKTHIAFQFNNNQYMVSKKPDTSSKPDDKKDKSAIADINDIERTLKTLSSNVNKLKSLFKSKSDTKKKNP